MIVRAKFSALKQGHWYEYLVRFALGGLATVVAGLVADIWGPAEGGLFLAFPAIFCASATLIEKHERERKERKGLQGKQRGKDAAALDAAGAGLGGVALAVFGAVMWFLASDSAQAPWPLQRSPGSSWQSCSGVSGAQSAFTEREARNQISLSAVRMPDLRKNWL
jgi:Protein of unknown function (DUF3147)